MANYLNNPNVSRGIRNNNPGNLIFVSTNKWLGKLSFVQNQDQNKKFEQFIELRYGLRALMKHFITNINKNTKATIVNLIKVYAPSFENDTLMYINTVAKMVGLDINAPIAKATKPVIIALCKAVVYVENGKDSKLITAQDYEDAYAIINDTVVKKKAL